jgi:hypothetical protein
MGKQAKNEQYGEVKKDREKHKEEGKNKIKNEKAREDYNQSVI